MEALLSLAFDNLSSKDTASIRKGLKQVEGLLVQICLSKGAEQQRQQPQGNDRRASVVPASNDASNTQKTLQDLPFDPAFREFFRLQESFEYNVATHLLSTLNTLLSRPRGTADAYLTSTLSLLHGILLLHPPSRHLFTLPANMDSLLDSLDTANPPSVQQAAILSLVAALLNNPQGIRTFEKVDGLLSVKDLLRSEETTRSVKVRVMEFLYFYLMPEAPAPAVALARSEESGSGKGTAIRVKKNRNMSTIDQEGDDDSTLEGGPVRETPARTGSGSSAGSGRSVTTNNGVSLVEASSMSLLDGGRGYSVDGQRMDRSIKSTRAKQRMLGQYFNNVDDLVQDLMESNLFV